MPKRTAKHPRIHRASGGLFKYSGLLMLILGSLLVVWGSSTDDFLWVIYGFLLILGGAYNWIIGCRLTGLSVEQVLQRDKRAPILYLRSFGDDEKDYSLAGFWSALRKNNAITSSRGLQPMVSTWGPTFQIQLARLFRDLGPYVAIGKPGESIAGTGASRSYVSDEEWQQQIEDWLREARFVVLRAGSTAGIITELKMLRTWNKPERIIMVLPADQKTYQSFRAIASKVLPQPLPEQLPQAFFMRFDREWAAYAMPQKSTLLTTLKPFMEQNRLSDRDFSLGYKLWNEYTLFMLALVLAGMVVGLVVLSALLT